jgi:hypothetical protein
MLVINDILSTFNPTLYKAFEAKKASEQML